MRIQSICYFVLALFLLSNLGAKSQAQFVLPLLGNYGQDYMLVNYVDWGLSTAIKDNYCDSKTYEGHSGTDFVIRDFRMMDLGVDVVSVKKGKVIFVKDGLFDREKTSVISKQLGNYVAIAHSGSVQTYYGHLRKGSIAVSVGDSVIAGQKIGQVGSSGNSESPHLHFEAWFDSTYYFDPFSGPCGNQFSSWLSEPTFNNSFGTWSSGMVGYVCTLDTLKEGLKNVDTVYTTDQAVTYWNLEYGLRANDSLKIEWYDPNGALWFKYGYRVNRDWWYYYYSSFINVPITGPRGKWSLKHYRNNALVAARPFYFYDRSLTQIAETSQSRKVNFNVRYIEGGILLDAFNSTGKFKIYNVQGQLLDELPYFGQALNFSTKDLSGGLSIVEYLVNESVVARGKIIVIK